MAIFFQSRPMSDQHILHGRRKMSHSFITRLMCCIMMEIWHYSLLCLAKTPSLINTKMQGKDLYEVQGCFVSDTPCLETKSLAVYVQYVWQTWHDISSVLWWSWTFGNISSQRKKSEIWSCRGAMAQVTQSFAGKKFEVPYVITCPVSLWYGEKESHCNAHICSCGCFPSCFGLLDN